MLRAILAFLVTALVALPAASQSAEARELKIGVSQYPTTFNPLMEASVAQSYVHGMTLRPVTIYDQDWQLACSLCVEIPTFENGLAKREPLADGSEGVAVTFRLQPEATWGDGTPVTSDDIIFTWQAGKDPRSGAIGGESFRRILAIDRVDDKTFTVHLDRVTYDYNVFSLTPLPAHIERPLYEQDPASYNTRTAFDSDPANPGLGYGPYRIVQVKPGSEVVLERNPTWYGAQPTFDRIRVITVTSTATLEANLLSGAIDMVAGELGLQIDQGLAFEQRHATDYKVLFPAGLFYEHIDLNLGSPDLADRRVRQALLLGIDRQQLVERLFDNRQPVATSPVSPLDSRLAKDLPAYDYDPERAAQLLEEAGWMPGPDGLRRNAEGETLTLKFVTTAGDRTRELVQQVLQAQWRQLGVEIRIDNQPPRVLFGRSLRDRQFGDMALFGWIAAPNADQRTILHSEGIPTPENGFSGQNYTGYSNPEMDALLDRFERELDPDKRQEISAEIQRLYMTDLPVLPLYWRANIYVLPRWLTGLRPTGHLAPTTLWIEDWAVVE